MGRGGWWVVSGSGKGVQKPDGLLLIAKSKSNTFINMNISSCLYQCYCLYCHFTICNYFIFPQKMQQRPVFLTFVLAQPLGKVHL